ncbi:MAG TPA: hypothetical protein DGA22_05320 [Acidobacterium sp.]|nr:hypothetical protein [Acidobacterium sp.]
MKRRDFIRTGVSLASGMAAAPFLRAAQTCGPITMTPVATPFGWQMHQVRQCVAGIPSFAFRQAYQQMDEWCWAASISMVFAYYGHPIEQTRIVSETWGSIQNMPAQNDDILRDLNKGWTDDAGTRFHSSGDMVTVNVATAVQDLQQNHPLIVGALGHATVLTALTSNIDLATGQWQVVAATVRDPWPANGGRRVLSPQEWYNIQFAARIRCS